jgi:hypothetical protein
MFEMESFMSACVVKFFLSISLFFSSFPFLAQEMDRLDFHNSLPLTVEFSGGGTPSTEMIG